MWAFLAVDTIVYFTKYYVPGINYENRAIRINCINLLEAIMLAGRRNVA